MNKFLLFSIFILFIAIGGVFAGRSYLVFLAEQRADEILSSYVLPDAGHNDVLIQTTLAAYQAFKPHSGKQPKTLLQHLRPYLSNRHLPSFFRLPQGTVEVLHPGGLCGNSARMLNFLFAHQGIQSVQWNMISNDKGHAAVMASLQNGGEVLLDPFFGLVGGENSHSLLSPERVKNKVIKTGDVRNAFLSLSDNPNFDFYTNMPDVMMAAEGQRIDIRADIPLLKGKPLHLGVPDDTWQDVKKDTLKRGMTPHWSYVGRRHDRGWVRHLTAQEDVRIRFTLTENPVMKVINANILPRIEGRTLIWDLHKGETLTFTDADAKPIWHKMRSYIYVDHIVIEPLA